MYSDPIYYISLNRKYTTRDTFSNDIRPKLIIFATNEDTRVERICFSVATTFISLILKLEEFKVNIEKSFLVISYIVLEAFLGSLIRAI